MLALDRNGLAEQISVIRSEGVASVAICFIHAYRNPAHEQETRQLLLDALPNLHVSISSEVCPEIREYERVRSEEHTSELQSLMRISYAVFCLKKKSRTISQYKINMINEIKATHKSQSDQKDTPHRDDNI